MCERDGQRVFQVAGGRVTFSSGEPVETPALRLEPGTNHLAWKPLDQMAEKVRILEMTVMEN